MTANLAKTDKKMLARPEHLPKIQIFLAADIWFGSKAQPARGEVEAHEVEASAMTDIHWGR
jgi:hypothetical protein